MNEKRGSLPYLPYLTLPMGFSILWITILGSYYHRQDW